MTKNLTYISLFSGGGVGCYGFKLEHYNCIATVEIIKRRLEIQKINDKCKYESGYINGDISDQKIKNIILDEINKWKVNEKIKNVDILISTPPCQGMSTANSKKNNNDIFRNSLIMESVDLIEKISPNFFIFENVPSFMKTDCISSNNKKYKIREYIYKKLSKNYSIYDKVINFKNYNSFSSRNRCLVIGVKLDLAKYISPIELFPNFYEKSKNIRDLIYDLPRLKIMGEISKNDIYHFYRKYDVKMRSWIKYLKPGESAYDNKNQKNIPHKLSDGKIVFNKNNMGGKYKRQNWDQVASCVHTRNDQLASQNTIHPEDDRVFSIRELMIFMSIPSSFKWSLISENKLNSLNKIEKAAFLNKNELNIRQIIGEAVPTNIFLSIAKKIKIFLYNLWDLPINNIYEFEKKNPNKEKNAAFYTDKIIINEIIKFIPEFKEKKMIRILEPSVGMGSFLPLLFKKYEFIEKVFIDVIDIDQSALNSLKIFLKKINVPKNIKISYYCCDFLTKEIINSKYDLIIGNPPFKIISDKNYKKILNKNFGNQKSKNLISYFLLKSFQISQNIALVLPKNFLISPQYDDIRKEISLLKIHSILDFENIGFDGVMMETICLIVENKKTTNNEIEIFSLRNGKTIIQNKNYILDSKFPNWIIYRNDFFDRIVFDLNLNIFKVFRDRQITNKFLNSNKKGIMVIRSRNIINKELISIKGYDKYIEEKHIKNFLSYKFFNDDDCYICPNFTTNIRVIKKPNNTLANGSVAIFKNNSKFKITSKEINWFSSDEFINFYKLSNNYQKNTINLDRNSIFYFGIKNNIVINNDEKN